MRIEIASQSVPVTLPIRVHVEECLRELFARHWGEIELVHVALEELEGANGDTYTVCRVGVRVRRALTVRGVGVHREPFQAIADAAAQAITRTNESTRCNRRRRSLGVLW